MKTFSKEFSNWPLHDDDRLNLTYVETKGNTVEEMVDNALISLTDWHGNEGPDWTIGDLSFEDYRELELLFAEALYA
jgi:hypothetical protein